MFVVCLCSMRPYVITVGLCVCVSGAPVRVRSCHRILWGPCSGEIWSQNSVWVRSGHRFYDQISPGQELQTHIKTNGNDIRPHTAQTRNERTSMESNLVTAQSTDCEPPEDGCTYWTETGRGNLTKMFLTCF